MSKQTEKLFTSKDFDKTPKSSSEDNAKKSHQEPTSKAPKSNTWLWILFGVIILAVIAYFILSGDKNDSEAAIEVNTEVVEKVETNMTDTARETPTGAAVELEAAEETPEVSEGSNEQATPKNSVATQRSNAANPAVQPQVIGVSNDVESEAMKVIRGDYGIGQERKDKLGTKYQPIQNRVNELKREGVF